MLPLMHGIAHTMGTHELLCMSDQPSQHDASCHEIKVCILGVVMVRLLPF
jgi:hypothetical protein